MRITSLLPPAFFILCLNSSFAQQDEASAKTKTVAEAKATPDASALTSDEIKNALLFANKHHVELATLLKQLRDTSPREFERGIRAVNRSAQKIKRLQKKQPSRHNDEVEKWKLDSRIRLMTAQWAMSKDVALEEQIKQLLINRQQVRAVRLSATRDKMAQRLKQINEQIARITREGAVTEEWQRLKKRATSQKQTGQAKKAAKKGDSNAN